MIISLLNIICLKIFYLPFFLKWSLMDKYLHSLHDLDHHYGNQLVVFSTPAWETASL